MSDTSSTTGLQIEGENDARTAKIDQYDGEPTGACIFLSAADLRELGVSADKVDKIVYSLNVDSQQVDVDELPDQRDPDG